RSPLPGSCYHRTFQLRNADCGLRNEQLALPNPVRSRPRIRKYSTPKVNVSATEEHRMRLRRLLVTLSAVLLPVSLAGQAPPNLSDTTRSFITVNAPVVALTHARLIDGTGAPVANDQTVVIQNGSIASVGP